MEPGGRERCDLLVLPLLHSRETVTRYVQVGPRACSRHKILSGPCVSVSGFLQLYRTLHLLCRPVSHVPEPQPHSSAKMRTFWHLPRSVRDTIYRLHLLQNEPITNERHREYVKRAHSISGPAMPPICHLSKQVEEEAAPIYYGENHFDIGAIARAYSSLTILTLTRRRHADLMTKITCEWCEWCSTENGQHSPPRSYLNFKELTRLKSLKELDIRVDETKKIKSLRNSLKTRQQSFDEDLTPQQQLSILRLPRILGILHLKPIEHVNFITLVDKNGRECGGPVRGGPLESIIPPRLRASKVDQDQGR